MTDIEHQPGDRIAPSAHLYGGTVEQLATSGIGPELIRLSVGLETRRI